MNKNREAKPGGERLSCPSCGTPTDTSDRFCRQCGAALTGDAKTNGGMRGLVGLRAFGLAIIALAVFYAVLSYGKKWGADTTPTQRISIGEIGTRPGTSSPTISSRGTADALFNQAMSAYETGDTFNARQFIPMAIAAYEILDELDPDARYHVALLSIAADRPQAALAHADTMLAQVANHLLALEAAARAQEQLGNDEAAVELYQLFLSAYTPDVAASRSEYVDHGRTLAARREEARVYLQNHGVEPGGDR